VLKDGFLEDLNERLAMFLVLMIFFSAFLFECYAFYFCFLNFGIYDLIVWISLIFSIIILAKTACIIYIISEY
jgi:hypothetical protein